MSDAEGRLYGLMEIAERQQAAVQAALDGLAAERVALARERESLAREVASLGQRTRQAVQSVVAESLAGAAVEGVAAVRVATRPLLENLEGVTTGAVRAEEALSRVVSWASWRLLGWIMGLIVALVLLGWLTGNALVWWDTGTVENLQDEITQLQANHDAWVKAGMLRKVTTCDPGNRPCIQVDERAGAFGPNSDYRVIEGY
jgi:type II secretory pathway component PulL